MFELRNSADPTSAVSIPSPTYTVNAAGGGTHTTVGGAVASADIANGSYQIVGITPGTYTGVANNRDVTLTTSKPKLLLIGLQGASKTIIQGDLSGYGWLIQNAAVVASLTFQKTVVAHYIDAP